MAKGAFCVLTPYCWSIAGKNRHTITAAYLPTLRHPVDIKTQLATIALAVKYNTIIPVWMGTTIGMIISNGLGIIVGNVMGKHIPERAIKWASALIFIAFGLYGFHENPPSHILSPAVIIAGLAFIAVAMYFVARLSVGRQSSIPICENKETLTSGNPGTIQTS